MNTNQPNNNQPNNNQSTSQPFENKPKNKPKMKICNGGQDCKRKGNYLHENCEWWKKLSEEQKKNQIQQWRNEKKESKLKFKSNDKVKSDIKEENERLKKENLLLQEENTKLKLLVFDLQNGNIKQHPVHTNQPPVHINPQKVQHKFFHQKEDKKCVKCSTIFKCPSIISKPKCNNCRNNN